MADGRHAAHGLAGVRQDEVRRLPDLARAEPPREPARVDPVRPARQDQQRVTVGLEHQAVGDRAHLAAQGRRGGRRRRHRLGEHLDVTRGASGLESLPDHGNRV